MSIILCQACRHSFAEEPPYLQSPSVTLDHVRSNTVPSELDSIAMHKSVQQALTYQSRCQAEIETLRATLSRLEEARDRANGYISLHQSLFSPIRRLPAEIMNEIFAYCCSDSVVIASRSDNLSSVTLSHVCHYWRALLLSSGELWAAIRVRLGRGTGAHFDGPLKLLKLYLERSCSYPLSLTARDPFSLKDQRLLSPLIEHSHRWKQFDVHRSVLGHLSTIKNNLPVLETLQIIDGGAHDITVDCFVDAPKLQTLILNGSFYGLAIDLQLPWNQLTVLHFTHTVLHETLHVLSLCRNVVSCSIKDTQIDDRVSPPHCKLPGLRSIRLGGQIQWPQSHLLHALFSAFTLPSLTAVEMEFLGSVHTVRWSQAQFLSMLERSSCSLETLSLRGIHVPDAELVECLEHMPLLRKLVLWHEEHPTFGLVRPISDELLVRLIHHRSLPLVPELEHLELRNVAFDDHVFADMVESRCIFLEGQVRISLRYLTVQFHDGGVEPGAAARLRNCRGLNLQILTVVPRR